jgi:hypothetical protein
MIAMIFMPFPRLGEAGFGREAIQPIWREGLFVGMVAVSARGRHD